VRRARGGEAIIPLRGKKTKVFEYITGHSRGGRIPGADFWGDESIHFRGSLGRLTDIGEGVSFHV